MYTHIVPALLDRVWSRDNNKGRTLWEIGNMGCVTPDAEALTPEGWMNLHQLRSHPDLPIATVSPDTGEFQWQRMSHLNSYWYEGPMHRWDGQNVQQFVTPSHDMWVRENKPYVRKDGTTADPGWTKRKAADLAQLKLHGQSKLIKGGADHWTGGVIPDIVIHAPKTGPHSSAGDYFFPDPGDMAELIGWFISEGYADPTGRVSISQSKQANSANYQRIIQLLKRLRIEIPLSQQESQIRFSHVGIAQWLRGNFGISSKEKRLPGWVKELPRAELSRLMEAACLGDGSSKFSPRGAWRYSTVSERLADDLQEISAKLGWTTFRRVEERDSCMIRGRYQDVCQPIHRVHVSPVGQHQLLNYSEEQYQGEVWCPSVPNTLWIMRYRGAVCVTGNSIFGDVFVKVTYEQGYTDPLGFRIPARLRIIPLNPSFCFPRWHPHDKERLEEFKLKYRFWTTAPDGTRLTNTYVEILTDTTIREYVNDELISERENPVGIIPIVHIVNAPAQGSPWGLSDIWEILGINREYNEKSTEVSDIINYHANPITVITGGKAPAMDVGPNKVWGVDNENAKVYNLENNFQGLQAAVAYLEMLKTYMFEAMGVPMGALGQEQAISNTSGVALSIQFMPTMQKFQLKNITYGQGFKQICALALRTLFIFEPEALLYNPETDGIIQPGQPEIADRSDPALYDIDVDWAPPLPVDLLIKLEEIQLKLALRLESRKGALKDLGEEFPDEKLLELAQELIEDAKDQAAIDMIKAHVAAVLAELTGVIPEGMEPAPAQQPAKNADGSTTPPDKPPVMQQAAGMTLPGLDISSLTGFDDTRNLMAEIVTRAYGYKEQARRDVDKTQIQ